MTRLLSKDLDLFREISSYREITLICISVKLICFRFSLKLLGTISRLDFATRILLLKGKVPLLPQYNLSVVVLRPVEHLAHS